MYEAVNAAASASGEKNFHADRTTIRRWISGVAPTAPKTIEWIATGWRVPVKTVLEMTEAQREWRYQQRVNAEAEADAPSGHLVPADPGPSAEIPVYATLPSWVLPARDTTEAPFGNDWPAWFAGQQVHLCAVVNDWRGPLFNADGLQAFLHREMMMFDALEPTDIDDRALYTVSRRQALIFLASLPLAVATSPRATLANPIATDAFLSECSASVTACWHLLRGPDLSSVEQLLNAYLVPLGSIAQRPSDHQQTAAWLASQAHRICGIVALHRNELRVRERHCQQAVHYATIAGDPSATVSALVSLASTHFYGDDPQQAATVYERALTHEQDISALQRSRVHAELAVVYGQLHREQDALRNLGVAQELYPGEPEQDRSFLYAEFTPASLALEEGLALLNLALRYSGRGYEGRAMCTFERVQSGRVAAVPDRIRFEIVNHQATTATLLNDLDSFETYFTQGMDGARRLQSKQRQQEAVATWRRALETWPHESRLRQLSDRFPRLLRESAS
jgi:tetratricopeptide (TPR) repeat protein